MNHEAIIYDGFTTLAVCANSKDQCEQILRFAIGEKDFKEQKRSLEFDKYYLFGRDMEPAFRVAKGFVNLYNQDSCVFSPAQLINLRQLKVQGLLENAVKPYNVYGVAQRHRNGSHEGTSIRVAAYSKEHAVQLGKAASIQHGRKEVFALEARRENSWVRLQSQVGYLGSQMNNNLVIINESFTLAERGWYSMG